MSASAARRSARARARRRPCARRQRLQLHRPGRDGHRQHRVPPRCSPTASVGAEHERRALYRHRPRHGLTTQAVPASAACSPRRCSAAVRPHDPLRGAGAVRRPGDRHVMAGAILGARRAPHAGAGRRLHRHLGPARRPRPGAGSAVVLRVRAPLAGASHRVSSTPRPNRWWKLDLRLGEAMARHSPSRSCRRRSISSTRWRVSSPPGSATRPAVRADALPARTLPSPRSAFFTRLPVPAWCRGRPSA